MNSGDGRPAGVRKRKDHWLEERHRERNVTGKVNNIHHRSLYYGETIVQHAGTCSPPPGTLDLVATQDAFLVP